MESRVVNLAMAIQADQNTRAVCSQIARFLQHEEDDVDPPLSHTERHTLHEQHVQLVGAAARNEHPPVTFGARAAGL
eukprot:15215057-Alexandrium_andersonii.AAC.1